MAKALIGLDIGSSSVKIVNLRRGKKGVELVNMGVAPLPPQTVVDRAIINGAAIVEAISRLVDSHNLKVRDACFGVSGHSVIIKKISLPKMSKEELDNSIQWEAEQYIPFDINDVYVAAQILSETGAEQGQMDVLLVAAKKDLVYDYNSVVTEAKLTPAIVDVDAFAVQNCFEFNYPDYKDKVVAIINIGASITTISVMQRFTSVFNRDISMGGNQFTEEIQEQLGMSYEEAEDLKLGGLPGTEMDSVIPQEVEKIIHDVSDNLADEIKRSFEFFQATNQDITIEKIFLCGGTSKISSLHNTIESKLDIEVEPLNPFKSIFIDESIFDMSFLETIAPMASVCVGLGLRRFI